MNIATMRFIPRNAVSQPCSRKITFPQQREKTKEKTLKSASRRDFSKNRSFFQNHRLEADCLCFFLVFARCFGKLDFSRAWLGHCVSWDETHVRNVHRCPFRCKFRVKVAIASHAVFTAKSTKKHQKSTKIRLKSSKKT